MSVKTAMGGGQWTRWRAGGGHPTGLGLQAEQLGRRPCSSKESFQPLLPLPYPPPNTSRVSGVLAVETGVWEEAKSSFQGRLGRGLGPSTPLTWGLAPGLLVLFLSQVRAEAAGRRLSKSYCLYT